MPSEDAMEVVRPKLDLGRSQAVNARLHALVPGGAHTYAKGDDQFPEGLNPVMSHGAGCHSWDVDGNEYIEYGMGLRSVTLGHAYPPVVDAVRESLGRGTNFVRPSSLELEAAESFLRLVTRAEMVKFTKDGSTANTAALKLARASTGRSRVALCIDHPFFSYDDWAMVVRTTDRGIPPGTAELTLTFRYNDFDSVRELLERHPGEIACFVLELERDVAPKDDFLRRLQHLAKEDGALVVADENVTGFRWSNGGAQEVHGLTPDLSTWGKGIANGFALSALAGRRELMELGGIAGPVERVFLLSTTHGAEHTGLAAAVATMRVYEDEAVIETMTARGERLRAGLRDVARRHGVERHFVLGGHPACLLYETRDAEGVRSQAFRTLFLQETIERGLLVPSFVVSYSHTDADVDRTIEVVDEALGVYASALDGDIGDFLRGRPVKPVDRRFN
jgi:glutamate-1-semialdehyde 2,1-aminomutase